MKFILLGALALFWLGCNSQSISVWKADGSMQCEGEGRSLVKDQAALEAAGASVVSGKKVDDGMVHVMACGTPTGQMNRFEISGSSLEKAVELGFIKLPPLSVSSDR